jgi:hypothetical protein
MANALGRSFTLFHGGKVTGHGAHRIRCGGVKLKVPRTQNHSGTTPSTIQALIRSPRPRTEHKISAAHDRRWWRPAAAPCSLSLGGEFHNGALVRKAKGGCPLIYLRDWRRRGSAGDPERRGIGGGVGAWQWR